MATDLRALRRFQKQTRPQMVHMATQYKVFTKVFFFNSYKRTMYGICHTGLLTTVSKTVWHIPLLCVQWKTPDDGQRNCSKHVEFYYKNKFEKLVHLVGFIMRICHDARSPERQIFTVKT